MPVFISKPTFERTAMNDQTTLDLEVARAYGDRGITAALTALIGGTMARNAAITMKACTNYADRKVRPRSTVLSTLASPSKRRQGRKADDRAGPSLASLVASQIASEPANRLSHTSLKRSHVCIPTRCPSPMSCRSTRVGSRPGGCRGLGTSNVCRDDDLRFCLGSGSGTASSRRRV
jgi:hypothetical protein